MKLSHKALFLVVTICVISTVADAFYKCCPNDTVALCGEDCCQTECNDQGKCTTCPTDKIIIRSDGTQECCADYQKRLTSDNGNQYCCGGAMDFVTDEGKCCLNSATYETDRDCYCADSYHAMEERCQMCPVGSVVCNTETGVCQSV